jgi:hypothetical protein
MASGSIGLTGEGEQQDDRRRDGKQAGGRCEVTNGSSTTIDDTTSRVEERPSAKRTHDDEREDRPPPRLGPMHEKSNPRRQAQPAAMATPTMSGGMRTASSSSQERVLSATQSVVRPIAAARNANPAASTVRLPGVPVTQDRLLGVGAADQPNLRTGLLHQIGKLGTPACFRGLRLRGAARRLAGTAVNTLSSFAYVVAGAYVLRRVGLGRPHWHSRRLVSAASSTTDRCLPEPNSFTTGRSWRWRPRCQQPRR